MFALLGKIYLISCCISGIASLMLVKRFYLLTKKNTKGNIMNHLATYIMRFLVIGLLSPIIFLNSSIAQSLEPPDEDEELQNFPHAFNMDTDAVDWEQPTLFPFDGAALTRIENPDKSGLNETEYVLQYEKVSGGQPWAGFFYLLEEPAFVTSESVFRLKVWSPRAGIRGLMKLEMEGTDITTGDLFADVTVTDQWTELVWNLDNPDFEDTPWDLVVVIMDLDMDNPPTGGENHTWYLDDFSLDLAPTSAEEARLEVPSSIMLNQNYPNPFNPATTIEFALPEASHVILEVYNMLGQKVGTLLNESRSAGWHSVNFDASGLSSGAYIYRLQTGEVSQSRVLTIIK